MDWLVDTGIRLSAAAGNEVAVWEFRYEEDEEILSSWAKHFRNHYCLDTEIDYFRKGYGYSRAEYLNNIKFPDRKSAPGPSIRAGDFGEILVADYLEYVLHYWVPRWRYNEKTVRNESTKGTDILGFKFFKNGRSSPKDALVIFEAKTQFSGKKPRPRLQDAVNSSAKDYARKGESLNAIKQRLYSQKNLKDADRIERFQDEVDRPYKEAYGAAALFEGKLLSKNLVASTDTTDHINADNLFLLVVKGSEMMSLVHDLYRRAADEA